jgi:hypothetical protein
MTNEELKIKLDEFLSKNKLSGITLANLDLIIKISELYLDLKEELADVKFSSVDLENYKRLDLLTKIDLVKKIFKKYNYPISNETIDKILSDGTIDFREYEYDKDYLPSVHEGIVAGCAGIKDDFRFISIPNSGYITDAVIFAHELAHYTVGIPENTTDHMVSESLAIFTEFLMEDELSSMGYNEGMKYVRKLRFKNTLNKSYLIRIMAFINVYFTFGDFEYDSYKKLYGKMTEESYNRELSKIKDYFASEIEDLHPQRSLYYIFGCVYAYYMYDKLKSDKAYINNIYQAFSIPYRTNLQSFSKALGIYKIESDLKEAITSYKTELNNETKTL